MKILVATEIKMFNYQSALDKLFFKDRMYYPLSQDIAPAQRPIEVFSGSTVVTQDRPRAKQHRSRRRKWLTAPLQAPVVECSKYIDLTTVKARELQPMP